MHQEPSSKKFQKCHVNPGPFSGIVPNIQGRVVFNTTGNPTLVEGLYVCGWLKRGPTGIIATNLYCAEETVSSFFYPVQAKLI